MPLTKDQVAQKVIARLVEKGEKADSLLKPDIISWIDEALQVVGSLIANSVHFMELQRQTNIVALTGIVDLSANTSILMSTIKSIRSNTGIVYVPVPTRESLNASFPNGEIGHYVVLGQKIFIKDQTGSLVASPTLEIIHNIVPTIATSSTTDLPSRFEGILIDVLINMAVDKKNNKPMALIGE